MGGDRPGGRRARPAGVPRAGHTVLDALRRRPARSRARGDLERTILALRACGAPVRVAGRQEPVGGAAALPRARRLLRAPGQPHRVRRCSRCAPPGAPRAIPAVRAAGALDRAPAGRRRRLQFRRAGRLQRRGRHRRGAAGVVAAGVLRPGVERAVASCCARRTSTAAYPRRRGGESNAQSTAWAVQGLAARGRNRRRDRRSGGRSPLGYLQSLVAPNGSVRYSRTSAQTPVWVTAEALAALAREPFPIGSGSACAAGAARAAGQAGVPERPHATVQTRASGAASTAPARVYPLERCRALH